MAVSIRADVAHYFSSVLPTALEGYEARPQQRAMADHIAAALEEGSHVLAEMGTGVGKSFGAGVPVILYALQAGAPAIIATGTVSLQAQYTEKVLPFLQKTLRPFRFAIAKGKDRYVCKRRLMDFLSQVNSPSVSGDWPSPSHPFLQWAQTTPDGDIDTYGHPPAWHREIVVDDLCLERKCPFYSSCFYFRRKEQMKQAQVIVANHHLLCADLMVRDVTDGHASVLPDRSVVLIDEAHRLEEAVRDVFGWEMSEQRFERWQSRFAKEAGRFSVTLGIEQATDDLNACYRALFAALRERFEKANERELHDRVSLTQPVEEARRFVERLTPIWARAVEELERHRLTMPGEQAAVLDRLLDQLKRMSQQLDELAVLGSESLHAYWVERATSGKLKIVCAPVEAGPILRSHLFAAPSRVPVVLMSATLTVGGSFEPMYERLGIDEAQEFRVESPFDFRRQGLLYLPPPSELPDPKQRAKDARGPDYHEALAPLIAEILRATQGRGLVLFTSYKGLQTVYEYLKAHLPYRILRQGEMSTPELLSLFQKDTTSVLCATSSFWEGIDVPGEALSCVIIDRLPFTVPDDPIQQALERAYAERGQSAFREVQIPSAVLRMRQAFGRLIRTQHDRGVFVILDRRVQTESYGRYFLRSLPKQMPVARRLEEVRAFFAEEAMPTVA